MSMNRVQFQKGMSLIEFHEQYGTEEQCEQALFEANWPTGFHCPACSHNRCNHYRVEERSITQCTRCKWQRSLKAGTVFQSTRLPLMKWFLAMYLLTQTKNNVSALELTRVLGVCYRTAWRLKHKLMQAMQTRETNRHLTQRVEVDDAYLGGEKIGGKRGRGSENKVPLMVAVEAELGGSVRHVRVDVVSGFNHEAMREWSQRVFATEAQVVSDGQWSIGVVAEMGCQHERLPSENARHSAKRIELRNVNTVISNMKTAISGTYHAFKFKKYAKRYVAEFQYRFNRRFDLSVILPRLLVACVVGGWTGEKMLRAVTTA